jgi:hypothetical protein
MSENTTKTTSSNPSSNLKLIIILLTIFLTCIAGWIVYAVKKVNLEDSDRKTCKIVLWVFTVLEIVGLIGIVLIQVLLVGPAVHHAIV